MKNTGTYSGKLLVYFAEDERKDSSPARGSITLEQTLDRIKNPTKKLKQLVDHVRSAPDEKTKAFRKRRLPSVLFPAVHDGKNRRRSTIQYFTGLAPLDFDKDIVREVAEELKQFLFDTYPSIIAAFISPSGAVKCIMAVSTVENDEQYKDIYRAITEEFGVIQGFDPAHKNPSLITFMTYDYNVLIRPLEEVIPWTRTKLAPPEDHVIYDPIECDPETQEKVKKQLKEHIQERLSTITDQGHFILRGTCKGAGGVSAYYGLDAGEIIEFIDGEIDGHYYLKSKYSTYKKTAIQFFRWGAKEPWPIDKWKREETAGNFV